MKKLKINSQKKSKTDLSEFCKLGLFEGQVILPSTKLTLFAPSLQNGQRHSNNFYAVANKLFECVWLFCGVGI